MLIASPKYLYTLVCNSSLTLSHIKSLGQDPSLRDQIDNSSTAEAALQLLVGQSIPVASENRNSLLMVVRSRVRRVALSELVLGTSG